MKVVTKKANFKGREFKFCCYDGPTANFHPSWWSHVDEAEVRERDWNIPERAVVLDIGAAYGSYTLTALAMGAEHVYAWSPQGPPGEFSEKDFLKMSLEENGWSYNVTFIDGGLYGATGMLHADTQEFLTYMEACEKRINLQDNAWLSVQTLDSLWECGELERVKHARSSNIWMKLDVEGAEARVLEGAKQFIATCKPVIQVENHNFKNKNIEVDVAMALGYAGIGSDVRYELQHTVPHHSVSHSLWFPK